MLQQLPFAQLPVVECGSTSLSCFPASECVTQCLTPLRIAPAHKLLTRSWPREGAAAQNQVGFSGLGF